MARDTNFFVVLREVEGIWKLSRYQKVAPALSVRGLLFSAKLFTRPLQKALDLKPQNAEVSTVVSR